MLSEPRVWRGTSHRPIPTRAALALCVLMLAPAFSGCLGLEHFLPTKDAVEAKTGDGIVRMWLAAKPGGLGNEFAHYNVSFGHVGISADIFLADIIPMKSTFSTVDLLALERAGKAAALGAMYAPPGHYQGLAYIVTGASIAHEKVVGSIGGVEVVRIKERPLGHQLIPDVDPLSTLRVQFEVGPGATTDLYVEVDLVRSLIENEDGQMVHRTVPVGVSVYVGGGKLKEVRFDGGQSLLGLDDDDLVRYGDDWEEDLPVPYAEIDVIEPVDDRQIYSGARNVARRMLRAGGLDEPLVFEGRDSISRVVESGVGRLPITEYRWDFGDGTQAIGPRVTHAYTQGGLFEVSLFVKDSKSLVGRTHMTLFVPYRADQAEAVRAQGANATLLVAGAGLDAEASLARALHNLTFDEDIDDGDRHLGGYRVTLTPTTPLGLLDDLATLRLRAESAHFAASVEGNGTLVIETAAVPVWRGPLSHWVEPRIDLTVDLLTGALVEYEVTVEGLYYGNLSIGHDPHPGHVHGPWPFGPRWDHLDYTGHVVPPPEEE